MPTRKKLTIDEIARLAFVSRSVVSRVLNHHPKVSDEARARVLKVIEEHHYVPSSVARSLATDRTFEICVITPRRKDESIANGFWPLLHLGISERSIERGYFVSLSLISAETAEAINDRILNGRVFDGYILITQEVTDLVIPALQGRNVPLVLIGRDPDHPHISSIDVDNLDGAYKATAHLIGMGHRRVAAILGNMHLSETVDRLEGYRRALADAGLEPDDSLIAVGNYSEKTGFDVMQGWLDQGEPPRAVFCASDAIATGALLALYKAGLAVPDAVAVVGFDDVPGARYTAPPLTTIHQPIYEKGEQAADIIIDQIEGRRRDVVHARLPAELVVRESCGFRGA